MTMHDGIFRARHPRGQLRLRRHEQLLIALEFAKVATERGNDAGSMHVVDRPEGVWVQAPLSKQTPGNLLGLSNAESLRRPSILCPQDAW